MFTNIDSLAFEIYEYRNFFSVAIVPVKANRLAEKDTIFLHFLDQPDLLPQREVFYQFANSLNERVDYEALARFASIINSANQGRCDADIIAIFLREQHDFLVIMENYMPRLSELADAWDNANEDYAHKKRDEEAYSFDDVFDDVEINVVDDDDDEYEPAEEPPSKFRKR